MAELKRHSVVASVTKSSILSIQRFVEKFNAEDDRDKVAFRIQHLDTLYDRHAKALANLELLAGKSYAKERTEMEELYNDLRDFLVSNRPSKNKVAPDPTPSCPICSGLHQLPVCSLFLHLPFNQKQDVVDQNQLCVNCLLAGHTTSDCCSKPCRKCNENHHLLLHPPSPAQPTQALNKSNDPSCNTLTPVNTLTSLPSGSNRSQLSVLVEVPPTPHNFTSLSVSHTEKVDCSSILPTKNELNCPVDLVEIAHGSPVHPAMAVLDVIALQSITLNMVARFLEIKCTIRTCLAPRIAGFLGQQLTHVRSDLEISSTESTLSDTDSSPCEPEAIQLKHGLLEKPIAARELLTGFEPPKCDKKVPKSHDCCSSIMISPRSVLSHRKFVRLKRFGNSHQDLTAEYSPQAWNVIQERECQSQREALPVGGRRGHKTTPRTKPQLFPISQLKLRSDHSCPPKEPRKGITPQREWFYVRNLARKFTTNRRGRPPDSATNSSRTTPMKSAETRTSDGANPSNRKNVPLNQPVTTPEDYDV